MGWSGMSLLMTDHTLCPRLWLAEEGFFLGPPPGWLWSDFISSLANTDPLWTCFPILRLVKVLGLDHWPNIYIDMGSLTFHPHIIFYCIEFLSFLWNIRILFHLKLIYILLFRLYIINIKFKWYGTLYNINSKYKFFFYLKWKAWSSLYIHHRI